MPESSQQLLEAGQSITQVDWSYYGPRIAMACLAVLGMMWISSVVIRKIASVMVFIVAVSGCSFMSYLILTGQLQGRYNIALAAAIIGSTCAVVALPALAVKKKD